MNPQAAAGAAGQLPAPTWSFWRNQIKRADRGSAWRTAGLWAIDRLSERLGHGWPERTWDKFGRLPAGISDSATHTVAYAELLELALRLELLSDSSRFARLRRPLGRDPREEQIQHLHLQLEIGALAAAAGHGISFEPRVPGGSRRADVQLDLAGGRTVIVEARVLLPDARMRDVKGFTESLFEQIRMIERRHGVHCNGEIGQVLDEASAAKLLATVDDHARLAALGATAPTVRRHGATLELSVAGSGPHGGLRGPPIEGDLWPRIGDRLVQKAEQTSGSQGVWLRVNAFQGLWQFTRWAGGTLATKLEALGGNIAGTLADHPHVAGVVMSGGRGARSGLVR